MKRIFAFVLALVMVFSLCACGSSSSAKPDATQKPVSTPKPTAAPTPEPTKSPEDIQKELQDAFKESIGGSGITFYKSVRNDTTGRWRVAVIYTGENMVDHALDYYKAYFTSDDELHFICNLGLKTTTEISVVLGKLQVDVREYVDKEEHDAKILNSGMLLTSYLVDIATGEIEEIN